MAGRTDIRDELDALIVEGVSCCEAMKPPSRLKELISSVLLPGGKSNEPRETIERGGAKKTKADAQRPSGAAGMATFNARYQAWYSQALRVIEQLLPDRYEEFRELYRLDHPAEPLTEASYRISDFIQKIKAPTRGFFDEPCFDIAEAAQRQFKCQIDILSSARSRLDSALANIEGTLQTTLLDDGLATAKELLDAQHLRSAGVVAGVVLERHLKGMLASRQIALPSKAQISSLNEALKKARVYNVPQWRQIQRLGDIRNLCSHDDERKPTIEEVEELISGTEKIIDTVF